MKFFRAGHLKRSRNPASRFANESDEEIIAAYHSAYFDQKQPHICKAFAQMGIDEHKGTA